MATSSNPIIWFSDDRDECWTYDFTKFTYLEQNPHIEKIKNIYFSKSWTTLNLQWYKTNIHGKSMTTLNFQRY